MLAMFLIGCGAGASGGDGVGSLPADLPDGGVGPKHDAPPGTVQLAVTVHGPGRITSQPAGIDCGGGGTACEMELAGDVRLVTNADTTVRWSGDCDGNGDCAVGGGDSRAVTADTFAPDVRTFDGDDHGDDACHAIAGLPGGGFVITGEVRRLAEGRNAWTRSFDDSGAVAWTQELRTPSEGSDAGRGVVALADGTVAVAGSWYSGSDSRTNNFISRISATGTMLGTDEGELIGDDHYRSIAATPSGTLVVAGALGDQAWVRSLGADGWTVTRGTGAVANRVAIAANGDVFVVGTEAGHGWVARYRNGSEIWSQRLTSPSASDVAVFSNGFAVAHGDGLDVYDDAGSVTWNVAPAGGYAWTAVGAKTDGSIVVAGTRGDDLVVRAYAPGGALRWERTQASASAQAAAIDSTGNVLVCGTHTLSGQTDALAVRYRQ